MKMQKTSVLVMALVLLGAWVAIAGSSKGWFNIATPKRVQLDGMEEYRKICERFLVQDTTIYLTGSIRLFDNSDTINVKEETNFKVVRNAHSWYASLGQLQTFYDEKVSVQLDTVNRYVAVSEIKNEGEGPVSGFNETMGLLFKDTTDIKITAFAENGEERWLTMETGDNPSIKSYRICYDAASYRLKSAAIEWWKDVDLANVDAERQIWTTLLSYQYNVVESFNISAEIAKVVAFRNGTVELKELYKDYQLHIDTPQ